MSIEPRSPPPQFAFRLKRALGGRAGWSGFALQILFVAGLIWMGYEIVSNAQVNLATQHIASGFGFMNTITPGFTGALVPRNGLIVARLTFLADRGVLRRAPARPGLSSAAFGYARADTMLVDLWPDGRLPPVAGTR